jgi:hypothetical protein
MATGLPAQLRDIQRLLREGRPTEADNQIEAIALDLDRKAEEERMSKPAPGPRSAEELTLALYEAIAAHLGNPPKITALIVELQGTQEK